MIEYMKNAEILIQHPFIYSEGTVPSVNSIVQAKRKTCPLTTNCTPIIQILRFVLKLDLSLHSATFAERNHGGQ